VPREYKLLMAALRMALKDPHSVGQRGLSLVLGAGKAPRPSDRFASAARPETK